MSGLTDRLRQVAGQATPGPWDWNPKVSMLTSAVDACVPGTDGFAWRQLLDREEAVDDGVYRHIATFDPVLVSAMLDVIDLAGCPLNDVRMKRALARFREVAG